MSSRASLFSVLVSALLAGCAASPEDASETTAATDDALGALPTVGFVDCVESIGVGLGPTAVVRPRVPASYILAGDPTQPVTPLAFRTAHCKSITVNGRNSGSHHLVQIGATIVSPDGTGDINNYQLYYYTDSRPLADALRCAGLSVQYDSELDYDYHACDPGVNCPLEVDTGYGRPAFDLKGTVVTSGQTMQVPLVSNWWSGSGTGRIRMQSSGPDGLVTVSFGGADLTATTNSSSDLARLFGSATIGFPILQQFNTVAAGTMKVSKQ
jgi:hypothetical protein